MANKLSDLAVQILTEGSKAKGYKRQRTRGEGPCIQWQVDQGRLQQSPDDAEVYVTTEAGKQALAEHKAAQKGKKRAA